MANSTAAPIPSQVKKNASRSERSERKKRLAKAAQLAEHAESAEQKDTIESPNNVFSDKKNIMWVVLSGAMALTFVVMLFLPDTGMGDGLISSYAAMLWCGFFGAALFRYRSASGWSGFAYGSVIGLAIQFTSQII